MYKCSKRGCDVLIERRGYCKQCQAEYYLKHSTHPRRVKLSDAELLRRKQERNRKYNQEHREMIRTAVRKYRGTANGAAANTANKSRRRSGQAGFTAQEWRKLCNQYNNTCLGCKCTDCKLTPDHVVPLSKGGSNAIGNIQPLCLPCNLSKATKETDYR